MASQALSAGLGLRPVSGGLGPEVDPGTANTQEPSAFFSVLPLEIRQMIYVEFWRTVGLKQHILLSTGASSAFTHSPCITDQRAPDVRYEQSQDNDGQGTDVWERRLRSAWCAHWPCEELNDPGVVPSDETAPLRGHRWSPFLPAMLTCKRMYQECYKSIYENLAFCFTEQDVLRLFLNLYKPETIRSIELCIKATPLLLELYSSHAPSGPSPSIASGGILTIDNNPWQTTCTLLASLTRLRRLHIWFDSRDLRPWRSRVDEKTFFARLWAVRAHDFVLMLPELHTGGGIGGGQSEDLNPLYLEGENLEGAPFVVERGPRPNKWRLHLSRMNQQLATRRPPGRRLSIGGAVELMGGGGGL